MNSTSSLEFIPLQDTRKYPRALSGYEAKWDYFTAPSGRQSAMIRDLSAGGILLCTSQEMEVRRWVRILLQHPTLHLSMVVVGRVVRSEAALDSWPDEQITLYRHGVELLEDLPAAWLLSLTNPHVSTCSCGSLIHAHGLPKNKESADAAVSNACGLCALKSAVITSRL
jgi:hypothetical protein